MGQRLREDNKPMRNVEIKIFNIARTEVQKEAVQEWLRHLGAENYAQTLQAIGDDAENRGDAATDPALLIALAAKRCYMSFEPGLNPNVTKVRKDMTEYLDNILKSGHGSVLEHSVYTFAIEGVSRVFTGEMNRHRAGVGISEGSMRFIRYTDIPYWLPDSIRLTEDEQKAFDAWDHLEAQGILHPATPEMWAFLSLARKKKNSQKVFERAFTQDEENYKELQEIWKEELAEGSKFASKKHITSMMRRIIPMGVATGGVWTMNIRAVRHIIAMRASEQAEEEILHVFSRIAQIMVEKEPMLCGDFQKDSNGFWSPKYKKV